MLGVAAYIISVGGHLMPTWVHGDRVNAFVGPVACVAVRACIRACHENTHSSDKKTPVKV